MSAVAEPPNAAARTVMVNSPITSCRPAALAGLRPLKPQSRTLTHLLVCRLTDYALELSAHFVEVGELLVDTGEADVRDFVEAAETFHGVLTDDAAGHFGRSGARDSLFNIAGDVLDRLYREPPLFASLPHVIDEFLAIELLATAILLDDHDTEGMPLISAKSLTAVRALSSAAYRFTAVGIARIDDSGVFVTTKGTFHAGFSVTKVKGGKS